MWESILYSDSHTPDTRSQQILSPSLSLTQPLIFTWGIRARQPHFTDDNLKPRQRIDLSTGMDREVTVETGHMTNVPSPRLQSFFSTRARP